MSNFDVAIMIICVPILTIPAPDQLPYNLTDRRHRYDIFFHSLHRLSS